MNHLTAMAVFRRVVELEGFSAAAGDLGLSNAAVSKNINELEAHLSAQLLVRTTRRVSVTEIGEAYYRRCVQILDDIDEAGRMASNHSAKPQGTLRINAPMSFGILHLAGVIADFLEEYQDIEVDLVLNDRRVDLIEGGFDIGLRIGNELKDSSLIARRLAPVRRVLCASPQYFEQFGRPKQPSDLPNHFALVYTLSSSPTDWAFNGPSGIESIRVRDRYRVNNSLALREALNKGVGLTLTPTFIVGEDLQAGRLETAMEAYEPEPQSLWIMYPQARHVSQKIRVLIDYLSERFCDPPHWDTN